MQDSLLRFSIGPVQGYIETARSVRDLWTGSYVLSWLTARALAEVINLGGTPLHPHLQNSPLVLIHRGHQPTGKAEELRSCLPNLFFATVPVAARDVRTRVRDAVQKEWKRIGNAVHEALAEAVRERAEKWKDLWDGGWDRQLDHYLDLRVNQMGPLDDWRATARSLGLYSLASPQVQDSVLGHVGLLERAAAAEKMVRHLRPSAPPEDTRPKCTQTGEDEQMGPPAGATLEERREFWKALAAKSINGEWIRERERFGAPALVKRFAWACAIAPRLKRRVSDLRSADTATIAAAGWIEAARRKGIPSPDENLIDLARGKCEDWSGTWLERGDNGCPEELVEPLRQARRLLHRAPPAYYAVLMMDGDSIGGRVRGCNLDDQRKLAELLHEFSLGRVPELIAEYLGGSSGVALNQPVYAGGDDVLALLPLSFPSSGNGAPVSVLKLAHDIVEVFGKLGLPGSGPATMSAGLAIVHRHSDLREALDAARLAERAAKNAGRNRLAIVACRRSGEHSVGVLRWDQVPTLADLVEVFETTEASDRWTYQLRAVLHSLPSPDAVDAELARLLARAERTRDHDFARDWAALVANHTGEPAVARGNALTLIQTASFMARNHDEDR